MFSGVRLCYLLNLIGNKTNFKTFWLLQPIYCIFQGINQIFKSLLFLSSDLWLICCCLYYITLFYSCQVVFENFFDFFQIVFINQDVIFWSKSEKPFDFFSISKLNDLILTSSNRFNSCLNCVFVWFDCIYIIHY